MRFATVASSGVVLLSLLDDLSDFVQVEGDLCPRPLDLSDTAEQRFVIA
jgi:hypothetical protein